FRLRKCTVVVQPAGAQLMSRSIVVNRLDYEALRRLDNLRYTGRRVFILSESRNLSPHFQLTSDIGHRTSIRIEERSPDPPSSPVAPEDNRRSTLPMPAATARRRTSWRRLRSRHKGRSPSTASWPRLQSGRRPVPQASASFPAARSA